MRSLENAILTVVLCFFTAASGGVETAAAQLPADRAAQGARDEDAGAQRLDAGVVSGDAGSAYRPCPRDEVCRIMPFGDSITDGYSPSTPGGYRVELFRGLQRAGKKVTFVGSGWNGPERVDGVAFPRNHEGHSGWTIAPAGGRSGISTLVDKVMPQYRPHVVLLMIGTNDAIDDHDMANAPRRLGALIDDIYARLPGVLVVVATPIPARGDASKGDDPRLNARIAAYAAAIPAVVAQRARAGKPILLVDMHAPFLPRRASLLLDPWHPNAEGYALIAREWLAALKPVL